MIVIDNSEDNVKDCDNTDYNNIRSIFEYSSTVAVISLAVVDEVGATEGN